MTRGRENLVVGLLTSRVIDYSRARPLGLASGKKLREDRDRASMDAGRRRRRPPRRRFGTWSVVLVPGRRHRGQRTCIEWDPSPLRTTPGSASPPHPQASAQYVAREAAIGPKNLGTTGSSEESSEPRHETVFAFTSERRSSVRLRHPGLVPERSPSVVSRWCLRRSRGPWHPDSGERPACRRGIPLLRRLGRDPSGGYRGASVRVQLCSRRGVPVGLSGVLQPGGFVREEPGRFSHDLDVRRCRRSPWSPRPIGRPNEVRSLA